MRIALLAHVRQAIAEPFMGGMEAHTWHLASGLEARGHDVTVFASGDSDARFTISPILDEHYERTFPWAEHRDHPELIAHVDRGFEAACARITRRDFDVVHNNSLHRFPLALAKDGMPTVTSLHVPPFPGLEWFVRNAATPWHRITVTSQRQLDVWWNGKPPPEATVVHNGIDPARWPFRGSGSGEAVWCGRITANKGPHLAAMAARGAGVPLTLFGVIEDPAYFDNEVRPLLGDKINYGGHLTGIELHTAIATASVLLFTPCWDEPFGLVAIEAMACGVPIAAFDMGAAREVVGDDGGCFASPGDVEGLAAALRAAMLIDRRRVHERMRRCFTLDLMLRRYEQLYADAIDGLSSARARI